MTKMCGKSDLLLILSVAAITFLSPFYVTKICHKNVTFLSPVLVNLKDKTYDRLFSPQIRHLFVNKIYHLPQKNVTKSSQKGGEIHL
jgi:hypothetical protein